ncbi:hypothetical protein RUM44_005451 [Polyplax serrata]|uniref:Uncharacterized protein n=1 Tax=Polyplax serrata TaxID=468196 RepID=A0ABR1AW41_POLSC
MPWFERQLMDTAYANIGLDANTTWRDAPGDGFQKCSDKLWVKLNYLKEKKHHQVGEKGKVVTVRDVIPQSKLARYGHYLYDNTREMMYNREKPFQFLEEQTKSRGEDAAEPWMSMDVEQEFRRLTKNCSQPYDLYYGFKPIDCVEVEESIQQKYPVLAKKCQPHAIDTEETLETICLPNPFYRIDDLNQLELQMRITSTKHIWENPIRNLMYFLNTQKYIHQLRRAPFSEVEFAAERNCNSGNQTAAFPSCSSTCRSPPSQASIAFPYRLIESCGDVNGRQNSARTSARVSRYCENNEILPVMKKRSSAEGHDFTNLTLLTRQYFKRLLPSDGEGPINHRDISAAENSAVQVPDTVLKWLQTGYPSRAKEFSAIQNLSDELRNVRYTLQGSNSRDTFSGKRFESSPGANLDRLTYRGENLSASISSSSSSEQNRSLNAKFALRYQIPPVSKVYFSGASSAGLSNTCQSQTQRSTLCPSKTYNLLGATPSEVSLIRDNGKPGGRAKYRPILNSQYREISDDEILIYGEGIDQKVRSSAGGMTDIKIFECYEGNAFDDLERQAIEQWPSDDSVDVFRSHHLQVLA